MMFPGMPVDVVRVRLGDDDEEESIRKAIKCLTDVGYEEGEATLIVHNVTSMNMVDSSKVPELMHILAEETEKGAGTQKLTKNEIAAKLDKHADKVLAETSTLDDVEVYVPIGPPVPVVTGGHKVKSVRLTHENRKKVLDFKLRQKADQRKASKKGRQPPR